MGKTISRLSKLFLLPIGGLLLWSAFVLPVNAAAEACNPEVSDCAEIGKLEFSLALGAGVRTNPLINQNDIPINVLFAVSYYGKRFFFSERAIGYTLFETQRHVVSALGTISNDQSNFNRWSLPNFSLSAFGASAGPSYTTYTADPSSSSAIPPLELESLKKRNMSFFGGGEYSYYQDYWYFNGQLLRGISEEHSGQEARFNVTLPLRFRDHRFDLSAGALWQDEKVLGYYYGISDDEAPHESYVYEPDEGWSGVLRFDWKWRLSRAWHVQMSVHEKWLATSIIDSPMITDERSLTAFMGGVYHF